MCDSIREEEEKKSKDIEKMAVKHKTKEALKNI
jgi:hypothetical protein